MLSAKQTIRKISKKAIPRTPLRSLKAMPCGQQFDSDVVPWLLPASFDRYIEMASSGYHILPPDEQTKLLSGCDVRLLQLHRPPLRRPWHPVSTPFPLRSCSLMQRVPPSPLHRPAQFSDCLPASVKRSVRISVVLDADEAQWRQHKKSKVGERLSAPPWKTKVNCALFWLSQNPEGISCLSHQNERVFASWLFDTVEATGGGGGTLTTLPREKVLWCMVYRVIETENLLDSSVCIIAAQKTLTLLVYYVCNVCSRVGTRTCT